MVGDLRTTEPFGLWSVAIPEAPAVLEGLRRRGLRLAVVSNSNGTVAEILHAVGLAPYFDAILDSAVVGFEKPDPRIFRHAADALGVRAEEAVHVGDLYSVDILGARSAGCRAILLDPAGAWPPTDCPKAADLAAAARLIEAMASRASGMADTRRQASSPPRPSGRGLVSLGSDPQRTGVRLGSEPRCVLLWTAFGLWASMKSGCSAHDGAYATSGAPAPTFSRAVATSAT